MKDIPNPYYPLEKNDLAPQKTPHVTQSNIVYVIGSLRNPRITEVGSALRTQGYEVFEDWHAGGPQADDEWQRYERERGRTYKDALTGYHAKHVFEFDLYHLNRAHVGVLVLPAGKSAHIELGYLVGQKKPTFVLFDGEPERYDVMYQFATAICFSTEELWKELAPLRAGAAEQQRQRTINARPWNSDR